MTTTGRALGIPYSTQDFDAITVAGLAVTSSFTFSGTTQAITGNLTVTGNITTSGNAILGDAAGDLVGVHGSTGTSQAAFVATMPITGVSVSGVIGFPSSAEFSQAMTLLNTLQQVLINHGFMAAS